MRFFSFSFIYIWRREVVLHCIALLLWTVLFWKWTLVGILQVQQISRTVIITFLILGASDSNATKVKGYYFNILLRVDFSKKNHFWKSLDSLDLFWDSLFLDLYLCWILHHKTNYLKHEEGYATLLVIWPFLVLTYFCRVLACQKRKRSPFFLSIDSLFNYMAIIT